MQLHNLPALNERTKKRIGRGGKRGSYSGRGIKGQKSRSGRVLRPALRDLIIRIPKRRGFRNKPLSAPAYVVNLAELSHKLSTISKTGPITIDKKFLQSMDLVPNRFQGKVKILGDGIISRPLVLQDIGVSDVAKQKIEAAGGRIILAKPKTQPAPAKK